MHNTLPRLSKLLAFYGTDISEWPEEVRSLGLEGLRDPEFAALVEREKHFEQTLHARHMANPSADLTQRIIAAASIRSQHSAGNWLFAWPAETRTGPAALAAMLVLGFLIGFGVITPLLQKEPSAAQYSSDDEGAIL